MSRTGEVELKPWSEVLLSVRDISVNNKSQWYVLLHNPKEISRKQSAASVISRQSPVQPILVWRSWLSILAAAGSEALMWNSHFQEKTRLWVRTWASWHNPSPSTAFEEYTVFKPWNHLQVYILCSRHFASPWAICFRRQTHGVSQKLINKFTTSFLGLGKSSMDECSTDKVLMLSCQRYLTAFED